MITTWLATVAGVYRKQSHFDEMRLAETTYENVFLFKGGYNGFLDRFRYRARLSSSKIQRLQLIKYQGHTSKMAPSAIPNEISTETCFHDVN